jgi:hypothetical protein
MTPSAAFPKVRLDVCCNDPDNGIFAHRAEQLQVNTWDGETIELVSLRDPAPRFAEGSLTIRLCRRNWPILGDLVEHGLFIGFETRSSLDLREVGSFVYAADPSTEVWVACYAIGAGPVCAWYPRDPVPADLAAHVHSGLPLVALTRRLSGRSGRRGGMARGSSARAERQPG